MGAYFQQFIFKRSTNSAVLKSPTIATLLDTESSIIDGIQHTNHNDPDVDKVDIHLQNINIHF